MKVPNNHDDIFTKVELIENLYHGERGQQTLCLPWRPPGPPGDLTLTIPAV